MKAAIITAGDIHSNIANTTNKASRGSYQVVGRYRIIDYQIAIRRKVYSTWIDYCIYSHSSGSCNRNSAVGVNLVCRIIAYVDDTAVNCDSAVRIHRTIKVDLAAAGI